MESVYEHGATVNKEYIGGLDLGQSQDYTAVAILEKVRTYPHVFDDYGHCAPTEKPAETVYNCRHLHRYPLGTRYPDIVDSMCEVMARSELRSQGGASGATTNQRPRLVIDATGCGRPVVDMFRGKNLDIIPVTITGGDTVNCVDGMYRVPKRLLVSNLQVMLQTEALKIPKSLPLADIVVKELLSFQVTVTEAANDTYGGRQGVHDDLVLAIALAVWQAAQHHGITISKAAMKMLSEC